MTYHEPFFEVIDAVAQGSCYSLPNPVQHLVISFIKRPLPMLFCNGSWLSSAPGAHRVALLQAGSQ
jgi:hypothetical protein